MVTLVVFLNLFFVPAIALWIHKKRRGIEPAATIKLLLDYAIFVVCNVPLTKAEVVLFKKLLGREISIDSGYYTLLGLIAAVILPYLLDWGHNTYKERNALLKRGKKILTKRELSYSHKFFISLLIALLIVITYNVRIPLEIYAGNSHEFLFSLQDFLPYMLAFGAVALLLIGSLAALLPDVPFRFVSALMLWFGAASWVQDLFLNKKIAELNGGPLDWASLGSLPKNNAIVWIFLLVLVVVFCVCCKRTWFSLSKLVAGAICVIQMVAIASIFLSLPEKPVQEHSLFVSGEKQFQLASEDNLIVFMLDTVTSKDPERMMEIYPEAADIMKDFTFYNNACCEYYATFPSLTHLLTGNDLNVELTAEDWMRQSWTNDRNVQFWKRIKECGYESRIYTENSSVTYAFGSWDNLTSAFDNIEETKYETHRAALLQKILKLSIYRCLPYVWKQPFEVLTMDFNDIVTPEAKSPSVSNSDYYQQLTTEKLKIDTNQEKLFLFQDLYGTHPPYQTDAQASWVETATLEETTRGCFHILDEFFRQLKQLGIYDNATIIVLSDHGINGGLEPIFYLKKAYETHKQTQINSAPIAHRDFQATILELLGCNDGSFGTSIFEWEPGDTRERSLYLRMIDESAPPVGSPWNVYYIYTYYTDGEELERHMAEGGPDLIIPANRWKPETEWWGKQ